MAAADDLYIDSDRNRTVIEWARKRKDGIALNRRMVEPCGKPGELMRLEDLEGLEDLVELEEMCGWLSAEIGDTSGASFPCHFHLIETSCLRSGAVSARRQKTDGKVQLEVIRIRSEVRVRCAVELLCGGFMLRMLFPSARSQYLALRASVEYNGGACSRELFVEQ